jgi:glycosyltransferase involved in cell wall biosynthesis
MTRIAVLTPSITTGDAVSNDVVGMYEILKKLGHETRIYAEGWTLTDPKVWAAPRIESFLKSADDLLIYHYSRGWDFGLDLLRRLKCRTAIKYHNVTPPRFFEKFNQDLVVMCGEGRDQLSAIAGAACDIYMSASSYNELDLLREGVPPEKCFVVAPFHHIDRLNNLEPEAKVLKLACDGHTNILMVGRVSPNKGHPMLIEAFAAYTKDYNPDSRLFIVGKEETRLKAYNQLLRRLVKHFKIEDRVVFTGEVTDSQLKAYYMAAHVFMITSEHEGFCVPLVEAMSMGVPVVAYGSSAIPGTVGGVGLVWTERDPYLLAESVNSIVKSRGIGDALGRMGLRRYEEHFTNRKIETEFLNAVGRVL